MEDIRIGIVGHGFMGHEHENMLTKMEGFRVIGISDLDQKQLKDVKDGIKRYASNEELMQDPEVQVVLIAVNNNRHHDLVIQAARAGKDIICEKPVAMNVEELDHMVSVVKECGVRFTVHHQRRLDRDFRIMKEIYDQRKLGEVYTLKNSLYGFNGNMHDWHVYISEGGGMLYDWGVHLIDQILYMIDSPLISVFADVRNVINQEVDDYFKILLRFENQVTAEIELGTYFLSDRKDWFERHWYVGGSTGSMYVDKFDPEGKIVRTSHLLENVPGDQDKSARSYGPTRSFGVPEPGLILTEELPKVTCEQRDYFVHYFKALKGEEDFLVKVPEVRRVLSVMEACRESARTMRSVDFER